MTTINLIDKAACGIEVSWSFGDGRADAVRLTRDIVRTAFEQNGFADAAPEAALDVDDVLKAVRRKAKTTSQLVVKEIARPNKDTPRSLGVYVRRAVQGESGDGWEMICRVRATASVIVCIAPEGQTSALYTKGSIEAQAWHEGRRLAEMANQLLNECHNGDVSRALVAAARTCGCIDRRPGGGGVYMLMYRPRAEQFVRLLHALEACTETCTRDNRFKAQIQEVYPKPLTIRTWAASASDAITAQVHSLLADLDGMISAGTMRESTMAKRADDAGELYILAEQARVFLQDEATVLQAMCTKIREAFEAATLKNMKVAQDVLSAFPAPTKREAAIVAPMPETVPVELQPRKARPVSIADLLDV